MGSKEPGPGKGCRRSTELVRAAAGILEKTCSCFQLLQLI